MKEKLISFKTAKLAKEKGFNIICEYFVKKLKNEILTKSQNKNSLLEKNEYSLSTQALLQKWIREIHKIDVYCDCVGGGLYYSIIYNNNVYPDDNDKVFEKEKETSYEEALEEGLYQALLLIPNKL